MWNYFGDWIDIDGAVGWIENTAVTRDLKNMFAYSSMRIVSNQLGVHWKCPRSHTSQCRTSAEFQFKIHRGYFIRLLHLAPSKKWGASNSLKEVSLSSCTSGGYLFGRGHLHLEEHERWPHFLSGAACKSPAEAHPSGASGTHSTAALLA